VYEVQFAASAAKEFRSLPLDIKRRIGSVIGALQQTPRPARPIEATFFLIKKFRTFNIQKHNVLQFFYRLRGVMKGIQFVTNEKGEKTAILIDLKRHRNLWEDFYDSLLVAQRANEPRESLEAVKKRLRNQGKLSG
jgi:mRNA-degrading endonuclease RelE of RelBE toxin-antitoxin system